MTLKDILAICAIIISVGSMIFHVGVYHQRLKALEGQFAAFLEMCTGCRKSREEEDGAIYDKVNNARERLAALEGPHGGRIHA